MILLLINILCLFLLFFTLRINKSKNAVAAALCLIATFFISSVLILLQDVDFLAPLFIIIYVGAIAVLFLFVIMVLKTKEAFRIETSSRWLWLILEASAIFSFLLTLHCFKIVDIYRVKIELVKYLSAEVDLVKNILIMLQSNQKNIFADYDSIETVISFAQCLFNTHAPIFLLAGIILLIALIGAIMLTHSFDRPKVKENDHLLSRSEKFLAFFKKFK